MKNSPSVTRRDVLKIGWAFPFALASCAKGEEEKPPVVFDDDEIGLAAPSSPEENLRAAHEYEEEADEKAGEVERLHATIDLNKIAQQGVAIREKVEEYKASREELRRASADFKERELAAKAQAKKYTENGEKPLVFLPAPMFDTQQMEVQQLELELRVLYTEYALFFKNIEVFQIGSNHVFSLYQRAFAAYQTANSHDEFSTGAMRVQEKMQHVTERFRRLIDVWEALPTVPTFEEVTALTPEEKQELIEFLREGSGTELRN